MSNDAPAPAPKSPVETLRDRIKDRVTSVDGWDVTKTKPVGTDEVVYIRGDGKKFVVKVRELEE